jgi:hypothetical protein
MFPDGNLYYLGLMSSRPLHKTVARVNGSLLVGHAVLARASFSSLTRNPLHTLSLHPVS